MSYGESSERQASKQSFRTVMDLGMGIFYVAIGCIVVFVRKVGTVDIPGWVAYSLGPMMAIGGGFRFYRGLMAVLPSRRQRDTPAN